ncbi:MAG: low-specificity L-threonine aldolase [Chloroflexi bacterium]|nr:low-specificity L-threonine aldolase [Chloroflexota bacterium]
MSRIIDLRSDTVTLPTDAMRQAMARAEVGDDVFGEDPTVRRLEEMAAERMGKEAGLLVVSGTMANLVSLLTHCGRGQEAIVGDEAHIFFYEVGGASALGGIPIRTVPTDRLGRLPIDAVSRAIRTENVHFPPTGLIAIENSHNRRGGPVLDAEYVRTICTLAHDKGIPVHMDGARIFNAAIALGVQPAALTAPVDSAMFCFSKGLSAPVGSVITGSAEFIKRARKNRKIVGGGMRQAGVLAAAAIVALEQMVDRLEDDHRRARRLAEGLAAIRGMQVDVETVQTNIVLFQLVGGDWDALRLVESLGQEGIRCLDYAGSGIRMVVHYGIEDEDIERTLLTVRRLMEGAASCRSALGVL